MIDKISWMTQMQQGWSNCYSCKLSTTRKSVVFGYGNPFAQVLVVGEAPGKHEDIEGRPFVGESGQLLDKYLSSVSTHPELVEMSIEGPYDSEKARELLLESFFYTNVVACKPPENRDPSKDEIAACRSRLLEIVYTVDPVIILSTGRVALEALLGKPVQITRDRGEVFDVEIPARVLPGLPARKVTYPCLAILHPSFLLRTNDFNQEGGMSDKTYFDVLKAMHIVDEYNWTHYGIKQPKERPKLEARKK